MPMTRERENERTRERVKNKRSTLKVNRWKCYSARPFSDLLTEKWIEAKNASRIACPLSRAWQCTDQDSRRNRGNRLSLSLSLSFHRSERQEEHSLKRRYFYSTEFCASLFSRSRFFLFFVCLSLSILPSAIIHLTNRDCFLRSAQECLPPSPAPAAAAAAPALPQRWSSLQKRIITTRQI